LALTFLSDPTNDLCLSVASEWEIAIKSGMKKLKLARPYRAYLDGAIATYGLEVLPIDFEDCVAYEALTFPLPGHRDPFDRMLITQALRLDLDVVGADVSFDAYGVTRHW
jgi:PIN domain nuclease of toxin-antitoxin system